MKIKKLSADGIPSFNTYSVELSYGQMIAIRNALEKDHSDPLSDEILAELNYYLQNIPGPGEDPDEFKAQRDAAKKTKDEAGEEVSPDEAPPSDTELEADRLPAPPSAEEEEASFGGAPEGPGAPPEGGGGPDEGPKLSSAERGIIDKAMRGGPGARPSGVSHGASHLPPPPTE